MISIDQLLATLFQDVAESGKESTPGAMVQRSLAGQLPQPDAPMSLPMALGGPRRSGGIPMPGPPPVPGPRTIGTPAAKPVQVAEGPTIPGNALTDLSQGYRSGGLIGAIGNLMQGPEMRQAAQQQFQRQQAEATANQNMTIKALMAKHPNMAPEMAAVVARTPALLKEFLTPQKPAEFDILQAKDGTVLRIPKTGGDAQPVYKSDPAASRPELSATDKKAIYAAEDRLPALESTIDTLNRARALNDKAYSGYTAGIRGSIGAKAPDWLVPDFIAAPEAATATNEFSNIMSLEAIKAMSETLKGATTDREMNKFVEMLGDPTTPPETRRNIIDRMLQLAQRQKEIATGRINDLRGGTYFNPRDGAQPPGGNVDAVLKEARRAIEAGKDPEAVKRRLIENGIDPEGL